MRCLLVLTCVLLPSPRATAGRGETNPEPGNEAESEQQVKGAEAIAEYVQKGAELAAARGAETNKPKEKLPKSKKAPSRMNRQKYTQGLQNQEEQHFAGLDEKCYPKSPGCPGGALRKTSSKWTTGYEYCECSDGHIMVPAHHGSQCSRKTEFWFLISDTHMNSGCICSGMKHSIRDGATECATTTSALVCKEKLCKIAPDTTCDTEHQLQCSTGFCGKISQKCVSGKDAQSEQAVMDISSNIKDKAKLAEVVKALAQGNITAKRAELIARAAQVADLADAQLFRDF